MTRIVIPDNGTIGSASDTDAIAISASGAVTFSKDINPNNFVGMIAPFGMSSVPTGWLACDGSEVSVSTYSDLHTAIGTTWGALTNGYVGSVADDHMQAHKHRFHSVDAGAAGTDWNMGRGGGATSSGDVLGVYEATTDGSNGTPRTGDETQPFNAGVKYCIKY